MKKILFVACMAFAMMACCNKAAENEGQEGACTQQEQCCKQDSAKCCKQDSTKCSAEAPATEENTTESAE